MKDVLTTSRKIDSPVRNFRTVAIPSPPLFMQTDTPLPLCSCGQDTPEKSKFFCTIKYGRPHLKNPPSPTSLYVLDAPLTVDFINGQSLLDSFVSVQLIVESSGFNLPGAMSIRFLPRPS